MKRYVFTFAALLALTGLTLGLSFVPMGGWNSPVALTIGAVKSVLVVLWFMHMIEHRNSSRVAFAVALTLAACLVAFTMMDVGTRGREEPPASPPVTAGGLP